MFPDLLVVRQNSEGFLFDILEPHNPSLDDNAAKAVGLAKFAKQLWMLFNRIQLIRKKRQPMGWSGISVWMSGTMPFGKRSWR